MTARSKKRNCVIRKKANIITDVIDQTWLTLADVLLADQPCEKVSKHQLFSGGQIKEVVEAELQRLSTFEH